MPEAGPAQATEVHCLLGERPARIRLVGDVDLSCLEQLEAAIATVADQATGDVVVDLSATTFLDSTGLGFLARLSKRLTGGGRTVTVCGAAGRVRRVLALSGMDQVVIVAPA